MLPPPGERRFSRLVAGAFTLATYFVPLGARLLERLAHSRSCTDWPAKTRDFLDRRPRARIQIFCIPYHALEPARVRRLPSRNPAEKQALNEQGISNFLCPTPPSHLAIMNLAAWVIASRIRKRDRGYRIRLATKIRRRKPCTKRSQTSTSATSHFWLVTERGPTAAAGRVPLPMSHMPNRPRLRILDRVRVAALTTLNGGNQAKRDVGRKNDLDQALVPPSRPRMDEARRRFARR